MNKKQELIEMNILSLVLDASLDFDRISKYFGNDWNQFCDEIERVRIKYGLV